MNLKIEMVDINTITPYKNNSKIHSKEHIDKIKDSIKEFGNNDPIGIYGPQNQVVEGHGRLLALKELKYEEIPVIRLDHLNETQMRLYNIAHNKLNSLTGFDEGILLTELKDLEKELINMESELDINITGFTDEDIVLMEIPDLSLKKHSKSSKFDVIIPCIDQDARDDILNILDDNGIVYKNMRY